MRRWRSSSEKAEARMPAGKATMPIPMIMMTMPKILPPTVTGVTSP